MNRVVCPNVWSNLKLRFYCKFVLNTQTTNRRYCHLKSNVIVSRRVQVKGHEIHYETTGNGNHTLLLLPGALGCSLTDFRPQLEKMNRDKFRVIAWDPPGYGKSIPPDREWPLNFWKEDAHYAAGLLETLGVKPVSLLGWSDGGISALFIASHYPQLVNKMVVWGANAYVTQTDIDLYKGIRDLDNWSSRMKQPFIDVYGETYFRDHWTKWVDAAERFYNETGGDICTQRELSLISCPTLVIHGQRDPLMPPEHPEYLVKHIQHSRLINMPEGKHNLHLRYADEFNKMVEHFLDET